MPGDRQDRTGVTPANRGWGGGADTTANPQQRTLAERCAAMSWAQGLRQVFRTDITTCPACGGDSLGLRV